MSLHPPYFWWAWFLDSPKTTSESRHLGHPWCIDSKSISSLARNLERWLNDQLLKKWWKKTFWKATFWMWILRRKFKMKWRYSNLDAMLEFLFYAELDIHLWPGLFSSFFPVYVFLKDQSGWDAAPAGSRKGDHNLRQQCRWEWFQGDRFYIDEGSLLTVSSLFKITDCNSPLMYLVVRTIFHQVS